MFQLTAEEAEVLRSQIVISNAKGGRGGRRYLPYAFTEQGVAMLSSVLKSPRAIAANVEIMRAFVRLREMLASNKELARKLDELERRLGAHDHAIASILSAIRVIDSARYVLERNRLDAYFWILAEARSCRVNNENILRFSLLRRLGDFDPEIGREDNRLNSSNRFMPPQ